jgi:hypothetical protein
MGVGSWKLVKGRWKKLIAETKTKVKLLNVKLISDSPYLFDFVIPEFKVS